MLTVIKFGGSSLADAAKIDNAANIAAGRYKRGEKLVVVVSAQGDTTDRLLAKAKEICPAPSKRELDALLSAGEQISMSLMAMKLISTGIPAVSLCGWQAGILTSAEHGDARITDVSAARIEKELSEGKIVVAAGFQGIDKSGDVTTVGRGGSDTTAAALAAALSADSCVIYTDVKGVYTADPRIVPNAILQKEIDYDDMLSLSSLGAGVLHDRSVETAKRANVVLKVASSFEEGSGTDIKRLSPKNGRLCGVAADKDVSLITLTGIAAGDADKLLRSLAENGITSDMMTVSGGSLSFSVPESKADEAEKIISEKLPGVKISLRKDGLSKISLVGSISSGGRRYAAELKERIQKGNVPAFSLFSGEMRISVLVPRDRADNTLREVHEEFFEK